jgi:hypothetical protein
MMNESSCNSQVNSPDDTGDGFAVGAIIMVLRFQTALIYAFIRVRIR